MEDLKDKPLKICIGTNTLSMIDRLAYANHSQFFFTLGKNYPNWKVATVTPPRMTIDVMRNFTAKFALDNGFDYVLFLDDDVLLPRPFDGLEKLIRTGAPIAAGWTIIRGYPFDNMFFKEDDKGGLRRYNDFKGHEDGSGIVECDAVGFSFCLIDCNLLRKIPAPYFVTGTRNTEDIYFCMKARKYVPGVRIVTDTTIDTGHIFVPEILTPGNRDSYKKYYEDMYPEEMPQGEVISNRDESYLKEVEEALGEEA